MNTLIQKIQEAVLDGNFSENKILYDKRINILYHIVLQEIVTSNIEEGDRIIDEIILVEKNILSKSIKNINSFNNITPSGLILEYSNISFEMALIRLNDQKPLVVSKYLNSVVNELVEGQSIIDETVKTENKKIISEMFLDFSYAAGLSEMTSLRMIPYIKQYKVKVQQDNNSNDEVTHEDEVQSQSESLILEKLDALQHSFDESIKYDKYKDELFDNMHRELTNYKNGLLDKVIDTMAMDIIRLIDSTNKNIAIYTEKEATEENYKKLLGQFKGISEDLIDILYRQNIESYLVAGDDVDIKKQKIMSLVETDDQALDNKVAERLVEGFEKDERILRPERINIYKYNKNEGDVQNG